MMFTHHQEEEHSFCCHTNVIPCIELSYATRAVLASNFRTNTPNWRCWASLTSPQFNLRAVLLPPVMEASIASASARAFLLGWGCGKLIINFRRCDSLRSLKGILPRWTTKLIDWCQKVWKVLVLHKCSPDGKRSRCYAVLEWHLVARRERRTLYYFGSILFHKIINIGIGPCITISERGGCVFALGCILNGQWAFNIGNLDNGRDTRHAAWSR